MAWQVRQVVILAVLGLAGCAELVQKPAPVAYDCAGGRQFTITFLPGDAGADVEFNRMRFHLRREPTDSGIRYACDVMTFTGKGEIADLDIQEEPAFTSCRVRR